MKRCFAAAVAALSLALMAGPAQARVTVYHGQWLCGDRGAVMPLGGIETQLWRRGSPDFLPVEWVGGIDDIGFANPDGTFSLRSTDSEDNHFIRMALRDAAGVRLKDWTGINDWSVDLEGSRNNVADRDLGGRLFLAEGQSHKCAIWRGLHLAHRDFRDLMGSPPPTGGSGGLLIQADAPGETPLTLDVEVWWTPGYVTGYAGGGDDTITRHEFGHVIRHGYDGDATHFFGDVAAYNYARSHEPCLKSGLGYAFNEGWAEYWGHDYAPAPACEGRAADDYEVEGNVAAALADLEARCFNGDRAAMVRVLQSNRGTIHSFQDFRSHVFCPFPLLLAPAPPVAAHPEPVALTPSQRAALARAQLRGVGDRLGRLERQLAVAEKKAATALTCKKQPCEAALKRAMLPAVLRTEIALTRLVRDATDDGDTATEQTALGKLPFKQLHARQKARERADRIKAARVSADGIRDALKAARAVFASDTSAKTRRLRSLLISRMAGFRKAQRGATSAPGLILDQAIVDRGRKVAPIVFPDPEPAPPPWTPIPLTPTPSLPPSALSLVCPASGKPGLYSISGALQPPAAGVSIDVHVTPPGGQETVQTTKTDGAGAYTTGVSMSTVGTWKMVARWAGDAKTQGSDSAVCQTTVS